MASDGLKTLNQYTIPVVLPPPHLLLVLQLFPIRGPHLVHIIAFTQQTHTQTHREKESEGPKMVWVTCFGSPKPLCPMPMGTGGKWYKHFI